LHHRAAAEHQHEQQVDHDGDDSFEDHLLSLLEQCKGELAPF
jgi:hypothetical protein